MSNQHYIHPVPGTLLSTVDYSRQLAMDNRLEDGLDYGAVHTIIGCGGIGFYLGILLSLLGVRNFILVDGDKIDTSNLARLPVPQTWVGTNKAIALRKVMHSFRPNNLINTLPMRIDTDNLPLLERVCRHLREEMGSDLMLWDTTDDARIQKKLCAWVRLQGDTLYRKIGYEGFSVGTYSDMQTAWLPENYQPGYRTTRANAASSVLAAVLGIFAQGLLVEGDFNFDVLDFMGVDRELEEDSEPEEEDTWVDDITEEEEDEEEDN